MLHHKGVLQGVDRALEPVRAVFVNGFEDQILAFEMLKLEIARSGRTDALQELAIRVHKIAGVAETLGFGEIGVQSAQVENLINELAGTDPQKVLSAIGIELEVLLELLEAELEV